MFYCDKNTSFCEENIEKYYFKNLQALKIPIFVRGFTSISRKHQQIAKIRILSN